MTGGLDWLRVLPELVSLVAIDLPHELVVLGLKLAQLTLTIDYRVLAYRGPLKC